MNEISESKRTDLLIQVTQANTEQQVIMAERLTDLLATAERIEKQFSNGFKKEIKEDVTGVREIVKSKANQIIIILLGLIPVMSGLVAIIIKLMDGK